MNTRTGSSVPSRLAGLSLMELVLVVTILGLIAGVVVPRIQMSSTSARQVADEQNRAEINSAVGRWFIEKGAWPEDDLSDIGADPDFFPDGIPTSPVDGVPYALDPATHRVK